MKTNNHNKIEININNYQEFMLDYFDGTLPEELVTQLHKLVATHQQIHDEIEEYQNITLSAGVQHYEPKASLYRTGCNDMELQESDFLMVKELEDGLTQQESARFEMLKNNNHTLVLEQELMAKTILTPDKATFANKSKLKRIRMASVTLYVARRAVAAVAIIALIVTVSIMGYRQTITHNGQLIVQSAQPTSRDITQENTDTKAITETKTISEEKTEDLPSEAKKVENSRKISIEREVQQISTHDVEPIKTLDSRPAIIATQNNINAYELGINHMMPLYVAMLQNENIKPEIENQPLPLKIKLIEGGVKILGFMSGSDIKFSTEQDEAGNIVAYTVITENNIFNKQIRR